MRQLMVAEALQGCVMLCNVHALTHAASGRCGVGKYLNEAEDH
jgi:hypothetical protein